MAEKSRAAPIGNFKGHILPLRKQSRKQLILPDKIRPVA